MKHYSFPLSGFEAIKLEILGQANKMKAKKKREREWTDSRQRHRNGDRQIEQNEIQSDLMNN